MKFYIIILFAFFISSLNAQNLVLNPGFENFTTCPVGFSQYDGFVQNWISPNTGSPDYYNACANPFPAGVPVNGNGFQQAHSGSGYSGIYTTPGSYREFIQVALNTTLVAGTLYKFSMFVCLHNKSADATDDLGAYLSVTPPSSSGTGFLTGSPQPQINNPSGRVITDTMTWVQITGNYIATGGERFITIGHFHVDSLCNYQTVNTGSHLQGTYYYIDDVTLIESNPLPVEMLDFSASIHEQIINLNWSTASEINNAGFKLYSAQSENEFKQIAWIEGNGTTSEFHIYTYEDDNPVAGVVNYYKLVQVDFDGRETSYNTIAVSTHKENLSLLSSVYDQANSELVLTLNVPEIAPLNVKIFSSIGAQLSGVNFSPEHTGLTTASLRLPVHNNSGFILIYLSYEYQEHVFKLIF